MVGMTVNNMFRSEKLVNFSLVWRYMSLFLKSDRLMDQTGQTFSVDVHIRDRPE